MIQDSPGCSIPAIEQCVCELDDVCCADDGAWDEFCVAQVDDFGCGTCPP